MPKRIIFCADGTWEAPVSGTNVYRLYKSFAVTSDQVAFYDDGVGADAKGLDRILDGAFGRGILQKIQDGYTKIAHLFEPGDELFLFGFSRGAYTVRSLAGMIANCGLPTGAFSDDCVTRAFAAYRDPANRAAILASLSACGLGPATIRLIGVWDTVGALGIPAIFGAGTGCIPEPATFPILAEGVFGIFVLTRRRRDLYLDASLTHWQRISGSENTLNCIREAFKIAHRDRTTPPRRLRERDDFKWEVASCGYHSLPASS